MIDNKCEIDVFSKVILLNIFNSILPTTKSG